MVFETQEELLVEAKKRLIEKFKNADFNYSKSQNLKDWFNKISDTCLVKKDADFLNVYESKLKIWEAEENKDRQAKLKKELEELEKKQNELKKLQAL